MLPLQEEICAQEEFIEASGKSPARNTPDAGQLALHGDQRGCNALHIENPAQLGGFAAPSAVTFAGQGHGEIPLLCWAMAGGGGCGTAILSPLPGKGRKLGIIFHRWR